MSAVQPKDLNPGIAQRGAVAHFQEPNDSSFKHLEEDISRLQSAAQQYQMITYKVGDFVLEAGVLYRNINAILAPEAFTPTNWKAVDGPSVALEIESIAFLGMSTDQAIPVGMTNQIFFDQVFVDGDASKIEDQTGGVIKLHNGEFFLSMHVSVNMVSGGGGNDAVIAWQRSVDGIGGWTEIVSPTGKSGKMTTGNSDLSSQPHSIAFVDAIAADVFVRAVVINPSILAVVQMTSTSGSIESHGTSAVANTPLTTKGDLLTHNDSSEQRLPVGDNGQVVVADSGESLGLKYVNTPVEIGRTVVSGGAVNNVVLTLTRMTKYMRINFFAINASGDLNLHMTFNGDDAPLNGRYTEHESEIYAGPSTGTIMSELAVAQSDVVTDDFAGEIIIDINLTGKVKTGSMRVTAPNGLNTDDEPYVRVASLLWLNTTEQIGTIEFFNVGILGNGIGDGSEFIAMGWD